MDVDGILTDGTVLISSDGTEAKSFHMRDGMGLGLLRNSGLPLAWISGRASGATTLRAAELKIPHLVQGQPDKLAGLTALAAELGLALDECVYMGDDIIDVAAIKAAGIGVSVPDGHATAIAAADYVTRARAGYGAVREVCDFLLAARGNKKTR
jgi:3-deoxy-D-manno-octulosonate 8-phosphate phosphatase (KDO 8-P phosphatase)